MEISHFATGHKAFTDVDGKDLLVSIYHSLARREWIVSMPGGRWFDTATARALAAHLAELADEADLRNSDVWCNPDPCPVCGAISTCDPGVLGPIVNGRHV